MPSYKRDFNSCAIRDGFCKSSHILRYNHLLHGTRLEPIMLLKLPIMLLSSAPKSSQNHAQKFKLCSLIL